MPRHATVIRLPQPRPEPPIDRMLLTVEEAAAALGVGRSLMFELIAVGAIETVRVGRLRAAGGDGGGQPAEGFLPARATPLGAARPHIRRYLDCTIANRPKAINPSATAVSRACPKGRSAIVRSAPSRPRDSFGSKVHAA